MPIPENKLETWSHQGSIKQSSDTYWAIRSALEDQRAPYSRHRFRVFLQGSYGNDTNVYAESDVDIVICMTSIFSHDLMRLSEEERRVFHGIYYTSEYTLSRFRSDVLAWLRANFGPDVEDGNRAIFLPGNGSRRDADVLVCFEHREYFSFISPGHAQLREGISFWTKKGDRVVNYPHQHSENCTTKQRNTGRRYKPTVRVLKNMRNTMQNKGYLREGVAPSYFLEGMLWNVPSDKFANNYGQTLLNSLSWLQGCDQPELRCANDIHPLICDESDICWNQADFNTFNDATVRFWNAF